MQIQSEVINSLSKEEDEIATKAKQKEVIQIKLSEEVRRIKTALINLEQIVKLRKEIEDKIKKYN